MAVNIYEKIVYQINNLLKQEDIYAKYADSIIGGKNDYKISQVYTRKNYSNDWIDTIEDCVVSLDNIVRNPRKFIVIEEDIVDISLARSISVESVKHLSQHTNLISSVTKDGMVIPSKILNTSKEESFDIYENRFIYTLLLKLRDFIDRRLSVMQNALMQSGELGVSIESEFSVERGNKVKFKLDSSANFPFDAVVKRKGGNQPTDLERITRIKSVIGDFLASPFAREMRSCALVRPPIQRTNVILKNPDFKKALVLWQFVETSENMEFAIDTSLETNELPDNLADKYRGIIFLNTVLLQSIASTRSEEEILGEKEEKKITQADEYVTKNIDDFVPDDFPLLKMDLSEIKRIYRKLNVEEKTLTPAEINKINGALDRVIRQQKINTAKEDGMRRQKLIAEQLKEEAQAKRLALREKKSLESKARREEARRKLQLKKEEEESRRKLALMEKAQKAEEAKKRAEAAQRAKEEEQAKREELARLEREREIILRERQAAQDRIDGLKRIQEERIAAENALAEEERAAAESLREKYEALENEKKLLLEEAKADYDASLSAFRQEEADLEKERAEHVARVAEMQSETEAKREEARVLRDLAAEEDAKTKEVLQTKEDALTRMREESEGYWRRQQELAINLAVERKIGILHKREESEMTRIKEVYENKLKLLEEIEKKFILNLDADEAEAVESLIELASEGKDEEEIYRRLREYNKNLRKRNRKRLLNKIRNAGKKKS